MSKKQASKYIYVSRLMISFVDFNAAMIRNHQTNETAWQDQTPKLKTRDVSLFNDLRYLNIEYIVRMKNHLYDNGP